MQCLSRTALPDFSADVASSSLLGLRSVSQDRGCAESSSSLSQSEAYPDGYCLRILPMIPSIFDSSKPTWSRL